MESAKPEESIRFPDGITEADIADLLSEIIGSFDDPSVAKGIHNIVNKVMGADRAVARKKMILICNFCKAIIAARKLAPEERMQSREPQEMKVSISELCAGRHNALARLESLQMIVEKLYELNDDHPGSDDHPESKKASSATLYYVLKMIMDIFRERGIEAETFAETTILSPAEYYLDLGMPCGRVHEIVGQNYLRMKEALRTAIQTIPKSIETEIDEVFSALQEALTAR